MPASRAEQHGFECVRIALICVSLRGGGTERIVSRIANQLCSRHEVAVITLAPMEPFFPLHQDVLVVQPASVAVDAAKPVRVLRQIRHLVASLREISPDLCMVFGEDIAAPVNLFARFVGVRRIWNFFRGRPERSIAGLKGRMTRLTCPLSNRIFVQTMAGKAALSDFYPAGKLTVWPNPIAIPDAVSPPEDREPLIVNIGSIGRLKNQQALVRVFADLEGEAERWKLLFVGDGPDRPALEANSRASTAAPRIRFAGEQKDVAGQLDRASIFAFTSLSEGFPNALAEAMAAGCACISYDCPTGPAELIEHGVNGFLVEMGDEARFAELLQQMIERDDLRAQFSRNARASMRKFHAEQVLRHLEDLIATETRDLGEAA